ncbi:phosphoadenosine phosphosulfate reductase [Microthyrium microscopicum]|uniref:FAD synthase n=1 Tax=Microthyrium microscopicum TaxID=703497 RepID=A0A6A6UGD3_9PEZI|nr:phosphoadenosine phosphosulfate reductase [Microthyrium microscopicum]
MIRNHVDGASGSLRDVCLELKEKVDAFLAKKQETDLLRDVQAQLRVAIGVVDEALTTFEPEHISISYNGGKDCLVLLIVILSCLAPRFPPSTSATTTLTNGTSKPSTFPEKLQAVYIVTADPFSEVDDFVVSSSATYHLNVSRYTCSIKEGLEAYLQDRPNVKAIFIGTRRTDPHGENLKHFDPTSAGWPDIMRVHPVIDWHYAEIWAFIRSLDIDYCPLYDQGYTSLGGTRDTHPNPVLQKQSDSGQAFRPAYELTEDDQERLGRDR